MVGLPQPAGRDTRFLTPHPLVENMPPTSQTVITLLRGINAGGKNKIAMDHLIELFEVLGFREVRSYLQSGNVLCETSKLSNATLQRKIEKGIEHELEMDVSVLCRTGRELELVIKNNPYVKKKNVDTADLHVTFLKTPVADEVAERLNNQRYGKDSCHVDGATVYLHCPGGYGRTKLSNRFFESQVETAATTRNWKTVNKLLELSLA